MSLIEGTIANNLKKPRVCYNCRYGVYLRYIPSSLGDSVAVSNQKTLIRTGKTFSVIDSKLSLTEKVFPAFKTATLPLSLIGV